MRKSLFFSLVGMVAVVMINSCTKAPVYPDTPQIEFNSVNRYSSGDSVIVTINFKDGDGDLGLTEAEKSYPYHEYTFVKDNTGKYVKFGSDPSLPAYNCTDWVEGEFDGIAGGDTVLIKHNPYYNNYWLDVYVKEANGSYTKFDFTDFCLTYNQRFPLLNSGKDGPLEGNLSYSVKFLGDIGLLGKTVKFRIQIVDRKLNVSNSIDTPDLLIN